MKNFKELALVIGLLLVVAALVFFRSAGKNRFSESAGHIEETLKNEPIFVEANNLSADDYFVVALEGNANNLKFPPAVTVAFEGLTDKDFREQLETSGKKILLTGTETQTAKAWVILNQLGIENLFILTEKEKPEVLRFTFIPDSAKTIVSTN